MTFALKSNLNVTFFQLCCSTCLFLCHLGCLECKKRYGPQQEEEGQAGGQGQAGAQTVAGPAQTGPAQGGSGQGNNAQAGGGLRLDPNEAVTNFINSDFGRYLMATYTPVREATAMASHMFGPFTSAATTTTNTAVVSSSGAAVATTTTAASNSFG